MKAMQNVRVPNILFYQQLRSGLRSRVAAKFSSPLDVQHWIEKDLLTNDRLFAEETPSAGRSQGLDQKDVEQLAFCAFQFVDALHSRDKTTALQDVLLAFERIESTQLKRFYLLDQAESLRTHFILSVDSPAKTTRFQPGGKNQRSIVSTEQVAHIAQPASRPLLPKQTEISQAVTIMDTGYLVPHIDPTTPTPFSYADFDPALENLRATFGPSNGYFHTRLPSWIGTSIAKDPLQDGDQVISSREGTAYPNLQTDRC